MLTWYTLETQRTFHVCCPCSIHWTQFFVFSPSGACRPTADHLAGPGHLNLMTRYGPLDVLGTIGRGLSFEDLLPHSSQMDVGSGVRFGS